jgi:hypothetical protein
MAALAEKPNKKTKKVPRKKERRLLLFAVC